MPSCLTNKFITLFICNIHIKSLRLTTRQYRLLGMCRARGGRCVKGGGGNPDRFPGSELVLAISSWVPSTSCKVMGILDRVPDILVNFSDILRRVLVGFRVIRFSLF